jgi:hypothetical protein
MFIILKGGEILGYVLDESRAKNVVDEYSNILSAEMKRKNPTHRIFKEVLDNGMNIYVQSPEKFWFYGNTTLEHTITWKHVPEYSASRHEELSADIYITQSK